MVIAASIQKATEDIVLKISRYVYEKTGKKKLCLAGGALGAALAVWRHYLDKPRQVKSGKDSVIGAYLGLFFFK